MANLSALGVVYRTFTLLPSAALLTSVSSRTAPRLNEELPYIEIWSERGGMDAIVPGTRDYEFVVGCARHGQAES